MLLYLILTLIWVGVIFPRPHPNCLFSLKNSKMERASPWYFVAFSNFSLETFVPNVVSPDLRQSTDRGFSDFWISGESLINENCSYSRTNNDTDTLQKLKT